MPDALGENPDLEAWAEEQGITLEEAKQLDKERRIRRSRPRWVRPS